MLIRVVLVQDPVSGMRIGWSVPGKGIRLQEIGLEGRPTCNHVFSCTHFQYHIIYSYFK